MTESAEIFHNWSGKACVKESIITLIQPILSKRQNVGGPVLILSLILQEKQESEP
jgi:hypothetical protein